MYVVLLFRTFILKSICVICHEIKQYTNTNLYANDKYRHDKECVSVCIYNCPRVNPI